jgi:thiamine kinase-like enzyme
MEKQTLTPERFVQVLQQYYGAMKGVHREMLLMWLKKKGFAWHYMERLLQEVIESHSVVYKTPPDLAIVKGVHVKLAPTYVPLVEHVMPDRKLIEEMAVSPEEGKKLFNKMKKNLSRKKI